MSGLRSVLLVGVLDTEEGDDVLVRAVTSPLWARPPTVSTMAEVCAVKSLGAPRQLSRVEKMARIVAKRTEVVVAVALRAAHVLRRQGASARPMGEESVANSLFLMGPTVPRVREALPTTAWPMGVARDASLCLRLATSVPRLPRAALTSAFNMVVARGARLKDARSWIKAGENVSAMEVGEDVNMLAVSEPLKEPPYIASPMEVARSVPMFRRMARAAQRTSLWVASVVLTGTRASAHGLQVAIVTMPVVGFA